MQEGSAPRWIIEAGHAPTDPSEETSRRLSITALLFAIGYLADQIIDHINISMLPGGPPLLRINFDDVAALLSAAISLLVVVAIRSRRLSARAIQDMGLIYLVVAAFGISISEQWQPWPPGYEVRGISWVCLWVTVFPLLVPSPRAKWALASFSAVSMGPLALLVAIAVRDNPLPAPKALIDLFTASYMAFGLSVLVNVMVVRLQSEVSRARRLGSYQLVRLLGHGGMGEVWEARHRMLARPAAIKLIRPEPGGSGSEETARTMLARFRREAEATARLNSPHTVGIYDFGITQEGEFYYVMERLNGIDLRRLVEKFGPLSEERAIHIIRQVCHSLAEAHAAGLIHRDVKPANILACHLGLEYDFVKVLDFGLVKQTAAREADAARETDPATLTQEHAPAGTPGYLPPEIILGSAAVDGRADIYSLGCVAYWLLTGHAVFEGTTALQVLMQHVNTIPVPPSRLSPHPVSSGLDALVLHCLAKDPESRPQSAAALSEALGSLPAAAGWSEEAARQWWISHQPDLSESAEPPAEAEPKTPSGVSVMGPVAGWQI